MQRKSALASLYQDWPQDTGLLLEGGARPAFLGAMRTRATAVEVIISAQSAQWNVYRLDGDMIDKDRYATFGTANSAGYVLVEPLPNDDEHHLAALPSRLLKMSGVRG